MPSIKSFCAYMRKACVDWSLGYDQSNRYDIRDGGESDCSSLVIWALNQAGFDTGTAGWTGNLSDNLTRRGWQRIPFTSLSQLKTGDILLNDEYHVCAVIEGSGATATVAQASIDERGQARGGQSGDQTGQETNVRQAYVYSRGWDCILRYPGSDSGAAGNAALVVDGVIGPLTVMEWQRQCGTTVDGVISGQIHDCARWYPSFASVTYEGDGSALMQEVQRRCGVPDPSGIIARGTAAKLQGHLILMGYEIGDDAIAGVLGEATAKAIQQSLNDGRWSQ